MRRPTEELKSKYYAANRDELLQIRKERYADGVEHFRKYERAIRRGVERASERRRTNRKFFLEKLGGRCVDCGYDKNPSILQFDHVDPKTKSVEITRLMPLKDREKIWEEVQKCVLRCANCHWEKTLALQEIGRKQKHELTH